jgi:hypothetical protein
MGNTTQFSSCLGNGSKLVGLLSPGDPDASRQAWLTRGSGVETRKTAEAAFRDVPGPSPEVALVEAASIK